MIPLVAGDQRIRRCLGPMAESPGWDRKPRDECRARRLRPSVFIVIVAAGGLGPAASFPVVLSARLLGGTTVLGGTK